MYTSGVLYCKIYFTVYFYCLLIIVDFLKSFIIERVLK